MQVGSNKALSILCNLKLGVEVFLHVAQTAGVVQLTSLYESTHALILQAASS